MQQHLVLKPLGESLSVSVTGTARSLPSLPANALKSLIQIQAGSIRAAFYDTTSLSSSVGYLMSGGVDYEVEGWDFMNMMRMISVSGTATICILYSGEGQP